MAESLFSEQTDGNGTLVVGGGPSVLVGEQVSRLVAPHGETPGAKQIERNVFMIFVLAHPVLQFWRSFVLVRLQLQAFNEYFEGGWLHR